MELSCGNDKYVIMLTCSHQEPHNIYEKQPVNMGPVHVPWDMTFFTLENMGPLPFLCVQELFSPSLKHL